MCPHCKKTENIIKNGSYKRPSDQVRFQRFYCKNCHKYYSTQTSSYDYRLRKRKINQAVFRLLCKGASQRGSALILSVDRKTIARRVTRFGACAKKHLQALQSKMNSVSHVVFDEMETFEHTKLKPVTIPLAVENVSRKILAISVGRIAAKGHLAHISKKKYGYRRCERNIALNQLMDQLKTITEPCATLSSDMSKHYVSVLKNHFPLGIHKAYKGQRSAVVGQGEMKKGGYDPLYYFNHTAAMIRDNIKRLTRKTWCTTKRLDRLLDFLNMYAFFHNQVLSGKKRIVIYNCQIRN